MDFLPLDRSGNRRFLPIMVHPERAEVHILEDEAASRAYIDLMWAEAMTIYRSGSFRLFYTRLYKSRQNLLFLFYINDQIQLIQL